MVTDAYLGLPFGFLSFSLHFYLIFFDHRENFLFYNVSLLCWVSGNCLWMTTELFDSKPSSDIHLGPQIPLKGIPERDFDTITHAKIALFFAGIAVQLLMYVLIWCNVMALPRDDDEDSRMINEASRIFCSHRTSDYWGSLNYDSSGAEVENYQSGEIVNAGPFENDIRLKYVTSSDLLAVQQQSQSVMAENHIDNSRAPLSLAYIENTYIIFWIAKDLFWSWGTGDPELDSKHMTGVYEAMAMMAGALALLSYMITAYLFRRDTLALLDCITTLFWIIANYLWMCGEFFIRYDNMVLDDMDQGNDESTRVASTVFFCAGMCIQLCVIYSLTFGRVRIVRRNTRAASMEEYRPELHQVECLLHIPEVSDAFVNLSEDKRLEQPHRQQHIIEMFTLPTAVEYEQLLVTFNPQEHRLASAYDSDSSDDTEPTPVMQHIPSV